MCLFVEAIKINNGVIYRLKYHQKRINATFEQFFPDEEPINLFNELSQILIPQGGIYKCRIVYCNYVESIELSPYLIRDINTLKLVETEIQSQLFKFENRSNYKSAFEQRGYCDDILLVKEGLLTDTSYSNIALYNGENWFTPRIPLLYGTNRAELLEKAKIFEKDIRVDELECYQKIALFNAMVEFGEIVLDISCIKA